MCGEPPRTNHTIVYAFAHPLKALVKSLSTRCQLHLNVAVISFPHRQMRGGFSYVVYSAKLLAVQLTDAQNQSTIDTKGANQHVIGKENEETHAQLQQGL